MLKEKLLNLLADEQKWTVDEVAEQLDVTTAAAFTELIKLISKLEGQRQIRFDKQGRLSLPAKKPVLPSLTGTFSAHKNGFGFVNIAEEEDDLFVGRNDVNHAIHGDTVEVVIKKVADKLKGTAAEAKIVNIVEHSLTTAVGTLILDDEKPKYAGYIKSKNQKISQRIYVQKPAVVLTGDEVLKVDIVKYPNRHHDYFVATVRDIVGHVTDTGIDVLQVLESMDIVSDFPEEVLAEANAVPDAPSEADFVGRRDLRDEVTLTIDGADAKDLDDAVHIKRLDNGNFELGVHIADVSYYVKEGSALDREAIKRGTSVYVTDRVVPMLPERLSNGICSLNPQVNRLTQSAIMEIDGQGRVVKHWVGQTVIKTKHRMTYSKVNEILAGDPEAMAAYADILETVHQMADLHEILEAMRTRRGALNFDTHEAKIIVNKDGKPVDIVVRDRGIAERMIESFMLAANETVAEHFTKLKLPFIYRIHEEPKPEKVQKFIDYASTFGVQVYGTANEISQEALQSVMMRVSGEPFAEVLAMMLLRSMQQARYAEQNLGHYGLAATYYTHFTSPIRRYPDLLVHRMMREYSQLTEETAQNFEQVIPELAKSSSSLERRAIDAEREVEAMKKAEYMADYVGEEFDAIVASVVKFGLFVELPNTVEGLIHVTNLPEFYNYNERNMTLQGERSGTIFRVGQPIRIKVVRADKEIGEIDFEYLPSSFDVKEKVDESLRRERQDQHRGGRSRDERQGKAGDKGRPRRDKSDRSPQGRERRTGGAGHHGRQAGAKGSKAKKNQKPFYKTAAKSRKK